jgi:hypothetical protein
VAKTELLGYFDLMPLNAINPVLLIDVSVAITKADRLGSTARGARLCFGGRVGDQPFEVSVKRRDRRQPWSKTPLRSAIWTATGRRA